VQRLDRIPLKTRRDCGHLSRPGVMTPRHCPSVPNTAGRYGRSTMRSGAVSESRAGPAVGR
jgi:hypothetical protein